MKTDDGVLTKNIIIQFNHFYIHLIISINIVRPLSRGLYKDYGFKYLTKIPNLNRLTSFDVMRKLNNKLRKKGKNKIMVLKFVFTSLHHTKSPVKAFDSKGLYYYVVFNKLTPFPKRDGLLIPKILLFSRLIN